MKTGTLYAIGTGPGAPDLLTVRAARILGKIDIVLAAHSSKNDYSLCLETAREFLPAKVGIARLDFPMTGDGKLLSQAWSSAARITCGFLEAGAKCAFLTLGDPLFYSTFVYLASAVVKLKPDIDIQVIPGISSCQAAAATTRTPLGMGNEILRIIPGTLNKEKLERELGNPDPAVIIKAYRNLPCIMEALKLCGRLEQAILVSYVENSQEKISRLVLWAGEKIPPYMSLILCPALTNDRG